MSLLKGQGAGGNNGGTNQPGQGGGGGAESVLDEAARAEIEQMINGSINGAISSHMTRVKKALGDEVSTMLTNQLGPIAEQLKALGEQKQAAPQAGQQAPAKKGELPPEIADELARARGQVEELKTQVAKEKQAREEQAQEAEKQRQAGLAKEARDALGAALRAKGVPDVQARAAVAMLTAESDVLGRSEDGAVIFKVQKGTGQAKYVDEVPVDKGVEEWLKTDEGKSFLPARQAGGAGGLVARPTQTGNRQADQKAQAVADLAAQLLGG